MKESLYRWLWSKIGGRPWTYIIRDTWHKLEGLWLIGLVAVGALPRALALETHFLASAGVCAGVYCRAFVLGEGLHPWPAR